MIFASTTRAARFLRRAIALVSVAVAIVPAVSAQVIVGTPIKGDTRLIQYVYDPDNTYLVLAKPKAVTHLQFAANETIRSVAAGDTANWELNTTKDRRNIFVKPKFEGDETSMTVLTDQRTYQFVLRSTGDGKKWYQRVSWIFGSEMLLPLPDDQPSEVTAGSGQEKATSGTATAVAAPSAPTAGASNTGPAGVQPEKLRFNYEISGDASFKPIVVFDDGRFTYYKLPSNLQELPALFAVTDSSDYTLVNFEVQGEYVVAQRLMPASILKLGRAEIRVTQQVTPKKTFLGFNVGP